MMVTIYAKELAKRVKRARNTAHARELSLLLHYEIVARCTPTRSEFIELISESIIMPQMQWDYTVLIPVWDKLNGLRNQTIDLPERDDVCYGWEATCTNTGIEER